jgi:hypothetical protein
MIERFLEIIISLKEVIISAFVASLFSWFFMAFWDIYRGPKITFEKIKIDAPDDFKIKLRNKGWREAAECIVTLETAPLSGAKQFLNKFLNPVKDRMEYILESNEMQKINILYSCWPITRDEILPDMTDMKAGATYEFLSYLPSFLQYKKERLKAGNWDKRISFPKELGMYIAAISVFNGSDTSFILIYEYLDTKKKPKIYFLGTIRKLRKIKIKIILTRLKLWLFMRKISKNLK